MVKNREYLCSVNNFNRPVVINDTQAIGYRLMELIMMDPGDNPLHPEMGVGLRSYRYGINTLKDLENRIAEQIATYLPMYQASNIALVLTPDKVLSVEITVGDTIYSYNTADTNNPITLEDLGLGNNGRIVTNPNL